jgi:ankyrin repeat protein
MRQRCSNPCSHNLTQIQNERRGYVARLAVVDPRERLTAEMEELNVFHRVARREDAPLHTAAMLGDEARVRALLDSGADPDAEQGIWGMPLNATMLSGSLQVVSLLFEHGASPLRALFGLPTPTERAALKGNKPVLDMLLTKALKVLCLELLDPYGYQAANVSQRRNKASGRSSAMS